jgi:hypothetical protein
MEQVIIEEQNKPLELDAEAFTRMMDLVGHMRRFDCSWRQ